MYPLNGGSLYFLASLIAENTATILELLDVCHGSCFAVGNNQVQISMIQSLLTS